MKHDIKFWQWVGFFTVSVLGTLLHFLYNLTGNKFVALFSAVNESTWEHMKLLFFPMFLFAIAEYLILGKDTDGFWYVKLKGILLGLVLIPALFYTIHGVFGTTPDFINITIFFIVIALSFIYEYRLFKNKSLNCKQERLAVFSICLILVCFFIFTYLTPKIPLFKDPVNGGFGI
jgi:hypothetical protein